MHDGPRTPRAGGYFERLAAIAVRRPRATLVTVAAVAIAGFVVALGLQASASTSTLVQSSTPAARATKQLQRQFGNDAVVVLVQGSLEHSVLTSDLARLISLEGCLSGNIPPQALAKLPHVCTQLARAKPAKVVYGPGTFINTAAAQIDDAILQLRNTAFAQGQEAAQSAIAAAKKQGLSKSRQNQLGRAAESLANQQFERQALQFALRYGLTAVPSIDNPQFVDQLVFDTQSGINRPKPRFAYLFPSNNAALILIRMRSGLSDPAQRRAISLFQQTVRQPAFKLHGGQHYYVTGVPVVTAALAGSVQRSIFVLLGAALVVMAATLMLVFRTQRRTRLVPLALALTAAAITYGITALLGFSLTMASIAALPVLIGLAVDYAIQMQARFDEARASGERPVGSALRAARTGAATIAGAALATGAGMLVLLLSPIPMVHGFALLVVLGIAVAFACALTAGLAALVELSSRPPPPADLPPALPRARALFAAGARATSSGRLADGRTAAVLVAIAFAAIAVGATSTAIGIRVGMLALLVVVAGVLAVMKRARSELGARVAQRARLAFAYSVRRPRKVLAIGLLLAIVGLALDTQTTVVSDVRQLVPQDLPALRDVDRLESATGVSGEIDVVVRGDNVTRPDVIGWMSSFQQGILARHGYSTGSTCTQRQKPPALCPAFSLTDLFQTPPTQQSQVQALLSVVPAYFSQAVISQDRRTAELAFGIRFMPLDRQKAVIDDIRRHLQPPPGVTAEVAGVPVLAAEANGALASEWRRLLTLAAAIAAVFLVLLAIRRRLADAAVPLIPIALASGWSALVLFVLRIPLNPMSAGLGALVIAISTEFSVLLSARYREERRRGAVPERALELTYASTGAAVLASGVTAIVGFGVLVASDIRMLEDFGLATLVDLTVSLLGVMVALPSALVWAEQHGPLRLRDFDPRRLAREARAALARRPALRPTATALIAGVRRRAHAVASALAAAHMRRKPRSGLRARRSRVPGAPRLAWRLRVASRSPLRLRRGRSRV